MFYTSHAEGMKSRAVGAFSFQMEKAKRSGSGFEPSKLLLNAQLLRTKTVKGLLKNTNIESGNKVMFSKPA